jgi:hypothetical protein
MTQNERALQLWPILAYAAHNRQLLNYKILSQSTGIPKPALGKFLDIIAKYCNKHNIPPLTAIVVSSQTGKPGEGFYYKNDDLLKLINDVFEFDYLEYGCPSKELTTNNQAT